MTSSVAASAVIFPSFVEAKTICDLAAIYESNVSVVVYPRPLDLDVAGFVERALLERPWARALQVECDRLELRSLLPEGAHEHDGFCADISLLVEIYAELFGANRIGLRMVSASGAMCPRFHIDKVGVRMVCTYAGPGTEWLEHASARRDRMGHGSGGLADERSGLIQGPIHRMRAFDVGLLKGEAWPGNQGRGAVHRSPQHEGRRLFVSLEAI
jgi:hypothetical protein